ncbi:MAG: flagellar protein FliS [Oceanicoccus sp.]|jgi:flagellar protein FliS
MPLQSSVAQYQQVSAQEAAVGASPHRLIQMLMQGALQRMAEARGAIQRKNIAEKGRAISKAIAIVGGLRDSLNMEVDSGLPQQMDELYEYVLSELVAANKNSDEAAINRAAEVIVTIKSGWDGIAEEVA